MIAYLQVAIISQALIFVTRAHGFFFMERPSFALLAAFAVAQLVSSIIAAYGNWGFTDIQAISGGWIGIIWVWVSHVHIVVFHFSNAHFFLSKNIIWFIPLDWIKFLMNVTVIRYIRNRREKNVKLQAVAQSDVEEPLVVTEGVLGRHVSRTASVHESLYSNRTNFLQKTMRRVGLGGKVKVKEEELKKVGNIEAKQSGQALVRHPSAHVKRDQEVGAAEGSRVEP